MTVFHLNAWAFVFSLLGKEKLASSPDDLVCPFERPACKRRNGQLNTTWRYCPGGGPVWWKA